VIAAVLDVKVRFFYCVVDFVFVFFCYVEYEWSEACVSVMLVLFPYSCASDGDYDACACFADFYG